MEEFKLALKHIVDLANLEPKYFRYYSLILFSAALLLGLGGGLSFGLYMCNGASKPSGSVEAVTPELSQSQDKDVEVLEPQGKEVCVEAAGAVALPGVYCLEEGSLVDDLIQAAGGFTSHNYAYAYIARSLVLSRPLAPSEKVYVPFQEEMVCELMDFSYVEEVLVEEKNLDLVLGGKSEKERNDVDTKIDANAGGAGDVSSCVNLNTATQAELESLDGVGESTAKKIIDARPFSSVEGLLDVSGIGEAKFAQIENDVCI